jgi:hypothetical protein
MIIFVFIEMNLKELHQKLGDILVFEEEKEEILQIMEEFLFPMADGEDKKEIYPKEENLQNAYDAYLIQRRLIEAKEYCQDRRISGV